MRRFFSFYSDIQSKPLVTYLKWYQNQYNAKHNRPILIRLIDDLNNRLATSIDERLKDLKDKGNKILADKIISPVEANNFVINYVSTVCEILESQNNTSKGIYHTNFTRSVLPELFDPGDNTQIYYSFNDADDDYFIDIRPTCCYFTQLLDLSKSTHKVVEGNDLNPREFTFHDLGHSFIMKRHDLWLFKTYQKKPIELISNWITYKNWYKEAYEPFKDINYPLYRAIKLYMFDIVHDRGYQFNLPILLQQFKASKNYQNLLTKIKRNNFSGVYSEVSFDYINQARDWLIGKTEEFLEKTNKAEILNHDDFIIKKYPDIRSYQGKPLHVIICKDGQIKISFQCDHEILNTSIYEIELLGLPTSNKFTEEKIKEINKIIDYVNCGYADYVQLDKNLSPLNFNLPALELNKVDTKKHLKHIEIYKLDRLLKIMEDGLCANFCVTEEPEIFESSTIEISRDGKIGVIDTGLVFDLDSVEIITKPKTTLKYINLDAHDRFVSTVDLTKSYIRNPNRKQNLPNYVELGQGMTLGIVDTKNNLKIAKAVSSLLTRSIELAKDKYKGGYLPSNIVERAQLEYVSPYAISNLWGNKGYRFVLSIPVDYTDKREIIGTALVASSQWTLFFFTNKYNNIDMRSHLIDQDLMVDGHKWFDRFNMPKLENYKPPKFNQLANFAVETVDHRGHGLGKLMIDAIVKHYALHNPNNFINHSQPLICGHGLFQIADPSWLPFMLKCGFKQRYGAETFYLDKKWAPLPSVMINGQQLDPVAYNQRFGLQKSYEKLDLEGPINLIDRIPHVLELANRGDAKLQYYQLYKPFKTN